jgi:hypothetical protein
MTMKSRRGYTETLCGSLAGIMLACSSHGMTNGPAPVTLPLSPRDAHAAQADALYARDKGIHGTNTNILVRRGLLADRAHARIIIYAESIRLGNGAPAEFPLIAETSGKDYESLAVSFAKPSAIHEALVFIGVPPGMSTDPSLQRFWPKGERIKVTFRYTDLTNGKPQERAVPAEQLIIDTRTGKTLPETGFVFTGSSWIPSPDSLQTGRVYAADVFSPNSIVSVYNESGTVLDVPRRASQHEVYSFQVPNPDKPLPPAQFIQIVLEPERSGGLPRVCDLTLKIVSGAENLPASAPAVSYELNGGTNPGSTHTNMVGILKAIEGLAGTHRDPFVTVHPDDTLSLGSLRSAATLIDALENEHEVRIDPPPPGHPYYRAFLPDEKHRERSGRPVQPWELHLRQTDGVVTGELVRVEEEWKGEDTLPTYHEQRFAVASADALATAIQQQDTPSVMLVFAPAALSYGNLRRFIAPVIEKKMILYIFLPSPANPDTKAPSP